MTSPTSFIGMSAEGTEVRMKLAVQSSVLVAWALVISGCSRHAPEPPLVRPVRTTVIRYGPTGELVSLSGQVQAQNQTSLAFRIGGRLIDRRVSVGDSVSPGQLVARIESQDAKNVLSSAEADLVSADVVPRAQYEDAQQQLAAAQSRVTASMASVRIARDNVGYTELHSNVAG